ncbi:MAG: 4'-phosphopantetheinyl transferase superfamily protein [Verrucomicrobia bacterium]|nr:4'-phosphopantetheinyl transferase superfamily protein [Verrucomicrobiota bacterium]
MDIPILGQLFPPFVVTECCAIDAAAPELPREEEVFVARAIDKRKREFATGRHCARKSLEQLGVMPAALGMNAEGDPVWPENIVGSISHCKHICGSAIASRDFAEGIGLDIEHTTRMTPQIARRILTDEEVEWIDARSAESREDWMTLAFSAKESVYKCLYPIIRQFFGFDAATLNIDPEAESFTVRLREDIAKRIPNANRLKGRYLFSGDIVATGVVLPTASAEPTT